MFVSWSVDHHDQDYVWSEQWYGMLEKNSPAAASRSTISGMISVRLMRLAAEESVPPMTLDPEKTYLYERHRSHA